MDSSLEAKHSNSTTQSEIERHRLRKWELLTLENQQSLTRILSKLTERYNLSDRIPQLLEPQSESLREAVEFYSSLQESDDREVFVKPQVSPTVRLCATEMRGSGEVIELEFDSSYSPVYAGYQEEFDTYDENKKVYARIWRCPHGKAKGTILAIPGWYMADPRLSALALMPGYFFSLGYNVVLYELPYTHRRMVSTKAMFPSSNLVRTNEGIFQSIYELRCLSLWLEGNGEHLSAVLGSSFGGYLAALWSELDLIDSLLLVSPVADLLATIENLFQSNADPKQIPALTMAFERLFSNVKRDELYAALRIHSPLLRSCKTPVERQLLLAADEDTIVSRESIDKFQRHLGAKSISSVPGGHFGQLCSREAQEILSTFLS